MTDAKNMDCGSVRALCEREMDDETIAEGMLDGARMDGRRSLAAEILDVLKMECRPVAGDLLRRICAYLEDRGDVRSEQLCEEIHAATGLATGLAATEQESVTLKYEDAGTVAMALRTMCSAANRGEVAMGNDNIARVLLLAGEIERQLRAMEEKSKGQGDEG